MNKNNRLINWYSIIIWLYDHTNIMIKIKQFKFFSSFSAGIYILLHFIYSIFFGNVSTGTDLVINLDLVKCITKININSYPNYNGRVEGGLSPER